MVRGRWDASKQVTRASVWAYHARPEIRGGCVTHQHFAHARGMFEHRDSCRRWPQQNQLPMQGGISRQYQVNGTCLHTGGSAQLDPADRGGGASDLGKSPVHAQRSPSGAATMVWTIEEQQQRVTAPLEKVGALVLGTHEQLAEDGVEQVAQLLSAFPAPSSQALGEWGEPGDVEQQQASIDDSVGRAWLSSGPSGQQPRHVRRRCQALSERRRPDFADAHS
jgi:hypothetical protein